jgi:hypothetical protein
LADVVRYDVEEYKEYDEREEYEESEADGNPSRSSLRDAASALLKAKFASLSESHGSPFCSL